MKAIKLYESKDLALKVYNDIYSDGKKSELINITKGDNYSKMLFDIAYILGHRYEYSIDSLIHYYKVIKNYNKNLFPIKNFELFSKEVPRNASLLTQIDYREECIDTFNELPSIIKRNLRKETHTFLDLKLYKDKLAHLYGLIQYLENKGDVSKDRIFKKAISSKHSIDDMINFFGEKSNLIDGRVITLEYLVSLEDNLEESYIIYNTNNIVVFEIANPNDMRIVGENSLWCFSYGVDNYNTFNQYTTNGICYVIFNLNESQRDPYFMTTWIRPLPSEDVLADENVKAEIENGELPYDITPIFDAINEPIFHYNEYLKDVFGDIETAESVCTFDM